MRAFGFDLDAGRGWRCNCCGRIENRRTGVMGSDEWTEEMRRHFVAELNEAE